ncbi:ThiF family adenylyltransferase [Marinibaculum pumilum]|uniref:ThiF family adenylyltransferase n=1 Tax=Marinibaculum pumilum TaxID=1766165 RepID=A0ABV7L4Q8_9PROT
MDTAVGAAMDPRFARQAVLPEIGPAGQERLARASVLLVGAGGLGCPAALYLAAAGVGAITIVDDDRVEISNLNRQVLFTPADAGRPKAECAVERLAAFAPGCRLRPVARRLDLDLAAELVAGHDLVVDGTDSFAATYALSDACEAAQVPLIAASVIGWEGYVGGFCAGAPGYRAVFPDVPLDAPNCDIAGILGAVAGMMGCLQAVEALKVLLDRPDTVMGRLLRVNADLSRMTAFSFKNMAADPGAGQGSRPYAIRVVEEARPDLCLVDVRRADERAADPLPLPSLHLPLDRLAAEGSGLPGDRPLLFVCQSGRRSELACMTMHRLGRYDVASLAGGLSRWRERTG